MGDGFINRENMFQLLRTSLISQAGEEDAEESVRVSFNGGSCLEQLKIAFFVLIKKINWSV